MSKPKSTTVTGGVVVLKVLDYNDAKIYIRRITGAFEKNAVMYEYLVIFNGELYSSFILTTLPRGRKMLTEDEEKHSFSIILMGATATVDTLNDKANMIDAVADKILEDAPKPT